MSSGEISFAASFEISTPFSPQRSKIHGDVFKFELISFKFDKYSFANVFERAGCGRVR